VSTQPNPSIRLSWSKHSEIARDGLVLCLHACVLDSMHMVDRCTAVVCVPLRALAHRWKWWKEQNAYLQQAQSVAMGNADMQLAESAAAAAAAGEGAADRSFGKYQQYLQQLLSILFAFMHSDLCVQYSTVQYSIQYSTRARQQSNIECK
jgi:hypothetical protein